jgi:hypothetical protein
MVVYRMWTNEAYRRQGYLRVLLDVARRNICYGVVVPVEQVGFSEPTSSGMAFARKWYGESTPWVIEEGSEVASAGAGGTAGLSEQAQWGGKSRYR